MFHDVPGGAHDHGGDAVGLEVPGRERHRLVADRAVGHQDRGVHLVGHASGQQFRAIHAHGVALASVGRHAMEARRQRPDAPRLRRAPQRGQRKPGIAVVTHLLAVDADMGNPQVMVVRHVTRIDLEELGRRVIGRTRTLRPLVRLVGRRCRQQGDPAPGQRLGQRLERDAVEMRVAVMVIGAQRVVPGVGAVDVTNRLVPLRQPVRRRVRSWGDRAHEMLQASRRSRRPGVD